MPAQTFPKILKQKNLIKCVGSLESKLGIFYLNNADINLIQNDVCVKLSKISNDKCQLLIYKYPLFYGDYAEIIFKKYYDEKTARQEYENILEADKKRRKRLVKHILSVN